ncbi:MAG: DUF4192 domain-containing protein, partial [Bifidobacteriaceae bacterium]|nr:DUF4192 domain-containing protein [Bifidobacteriaceae bacterium]
MVRAPIVIKNASGLDVVAALPGMFGFHPRDSLVVCGLCPPRGRLGMTIRVDLAGLGAPGFATLVLDNVARVAASGALGAFVVRYAPAAAPPPQQDQAFQDLLAA